MQSGRLFRETIQKLCVRWFILLYAYSSNEKLHVLLWTSCQHCMFRSISWGYKGHEVSSRNAWQDVDIPARTPDLDVYIELIEAKKARNARRPLQILLFSHKRAPTRSYLLSPGPTIQLSTKTRSCMKLNSLWSNTISKALTIASNMSKLGREFLMDHLGSGRELERPLCGSNGSTWEWR